MKINKIQGLIAAPFTPMYDDGRVKPEMIKSYAQKLKSDGLTGVFVCGTTGEGMLMTSEERRIIAEAWIAEQTEDFKVIVHVGTTSAKQSAELAEHAQKKGAWAVGSMGPIFLQPSGLKELVGFCAEVASACTDLPFYYYHIPSISGINLSMSEFIKQAAKQIPNFVGIKFTDNNFMEMQKCLQLDNMKWDILHGFDEILMAGLSFGVEGAVGSTYNYVAPLYIDLIENFKKGKIEAARAFQTKSVEIVDVLLRYKGALVAGKAIMKMVGVDCGSCRSPLTKLNTEELKKLKSNLREVGFFEFNILKNGT